MKIQSLEAWLTGRGTPTKEKKKILYYFRTNRRERNNKWEGLLLAYEIYVMWWHPDTDNKIFMHWLLSRHYEDEDYNSLNQNDNTEEGRVSLPS